MKGIDSSILKNNTTLVTILMNNHKSEHLKQIYNLLIKADEIIFIKQLVMCMT